MKESKYDKIEEPNIIEETSDLDLSGDSDRSRVFSKELARYVGVIGAIFIVIFQIYTGLFGNFVPLIQRPIHLGILLALGILISPLKKGEKNKTYVPWYDWVLMLITIVVCGNIILIRDQILFQPLYWPPIQFIFGVIMLLISLEVVRRRIGNIFIGLVAVFLLYYFAGRYLPGYFQTPPSNLGILISRTYLDTFGFWGRLTSLSASMIALFVIFGGFLLHFGAANTIIKVGYWLAQRTVGGSAKMAVVSSMLLGMINGSTIANVTTTGVITIPMMKRSGWSPEEAAAIEGVASTGSTFIPPVMGNSIFIMAMFLGMAYIDIAKYAILPASIYFIAIFLWVHLIAKKRKLEGVREQYQQARINFLNIIHLVIPVGVLMYFFINRYSPTTVASYTVVSILIISFLDFLLLKRDILLLLKTFIKLCCAVLPSLVTIASMLAVANIILALIQLTGLGIKVSYVIFSLAAGNLPLSLMLTMLVALILSMGLPGSASYVLCIAVLAPAIIKLDVDPFLVHMFIFYFTGLAPITPPIGAACFISSSIARANWLKAMLIAVKICSIIFFVPFIWIYSPALLLQGTITEILFTYLPVLLSTVLLTMVWASYCVDILKAYEKIIILVGAFLIISPLLIKAWDVSVTVLGIVISFGVLIQHIIRVKKTNKLIVQNENM